MRAERATRFKNPALLFHLLVLLLVVASMAAAGRKEVAAACGDVAAQGLAALRCSLTGWAAQVLDGRAPLPPRPAQAG